MEEIFSIKWEVSHFDLENEVLVDMNRTVILYDEYMNVGAFRQRELKNKSPKEKTKSGFYCYIYNCCELIDLQDCNQKLTVGYIRRIARNRRQ